jgi:hypothetical protein
MKSILLALPLVALLGACKSSERSETVSTTPVVGTPRTGIVDAVYEVVDDASGNPIGRVKKIRYGSSGVIYWVYDRDGQRRGYVLSNNRAYVYDWHGGQRSQDARFLGADTITSGARSILGHVRPARLEETSLEKIAAGAEETPEAPRPE